MVTPMVTPTVTPMVSIPPTGIVAFPLLGAAILMLGYTIVSIPPTGIVAFPLETPTVTATMPIPTETVSIPPTGIVAFPHPSLP